VGRRRGRTTLVGRDEAARDGQIAHLHGLNLTRAWCWRRLAEQLADDDPRAPVMLDAAGCHAEPELAHTGGSNYMVEHWLAAYAVLYLT
jgi:hypothetical protein